MKTWGSEDSMNKKLSTLLILVSLLSTSSAFALETKSSESSQKVTTAAPQDATVFTQTAEENPAQEAVTQRKTFSKFFLNFARKPKKQVAKENKADDSKVSAEATLDNNAQKPVETPKKKLLRVKNTDKKAAKIPTEEEIKIEANKVIKGSVAETKLVSVDDCVKYALTFHPAIRYYANTSEIYKSKIAQAWSAFFPVFGLDANYSRNDMLTTNMNIPTQKYGTYNMPKVSAQMMLFDFGKTKSQVDMSKATYEASQQDLKMSINDIIYNVKKSYFNLLYALEQAKVYSDTVKDYESHLKQAQAFYQIGTKAKIDVTTAEYNLGKAKLNYIKAQNNVSLAYAQVSSAMGIPEFTTYHIVEKFPTSKYSVNFDEVLNTAYSTTPELLSAKKRSDASGILIKASVRAFAPDVTAFGGYTLGGKTPAYDHGYQLGAGLTYQTTNLMLLKKQVDEAKLTHNRDLADYERVRQTVYLNVKQAYIDLYNAQDSIPVARLSMKQAKQQYDLASGRYRVGLGDAIELKDAENTYRTSQLDYYSSLLNYNISAANLERVIGSPVKPVPGALI